jgi:hypothetical protein
MLGFVAAVFWVLPAFAAPTDAQKCEAAKLRAAGKKASCEAKVLAKLALGREADVAKCDAAFAAAFAKAEEKGGCGTTGDSGTVASRIGDFVVVIDGVLDPGGPFHDNGDGTVTDFRTGLQWEKKVAGSGCLHCSNDLYYWSGASAVDPDGNVFTSFLAGLNQHLVLEASPVAPAGFIIPDIVLFGCFANHCDWRLPTLAELHTIVDPGAPGGCNPCSQTCVDPIFGARDINGIGLYWTSTEAGDEVPALFDVLTVQFCGDDEVGTTVPYDKIHPARVRAVRGGF